MPLYDFQCSQCRSVSTLRRTIPEMDAPAECVNDGAALERMFSPTRNIHVPIAFRAVRKNGLEGGYSWSDFHSHSEKELAHLKDLNGKPVEVVPSAEYMSMAGAGDGALTPERQAAKVEKPLQQAFDKAWDRHNVIRSF